MPVKDIDRLRLVKREEADDAIAFGVDLIVRRAAIVQANLVHRRVDVVHARRVRKGLRPTVPNICSGVHSSAFGIVGGRGCGERDFGVVIL